MDTYNKQFIVVVVILLIVSTFNIIRLINNHYPSLLIDFIFHGLTIFVGLFLFYYFYISNLIRKSTDKTFENLLTNNEQTSAVIKELVTDKLTPDQTTQIKDILKKNINDTGSSPIVDKSNKKNTEVFNNGIAVCIVFFVLTIVLTLSFKFYSNYEINIGSIILVNLYLFIITLSADFLMIEYISYYDIAPLSANETLNAAFDRFKNNLEDI